MSGPPHRPSVSSRGPVLAVAMGSHSECCYSGGANARIHSWKIPDLNMDPYDGYGEDSSLPSSFPPPTCPWEPLGSSAPGLHTSRTQEGTPRAPALGKPGPR